MNWDSPHLALDPAAYWVKSPALGYEVVNRYKTKAQGLGSGDQEGQAEGPFLCFHLILCPRLRKSKGRANN